MKRFVFILLVFAFISSGYAQKEVENTTKSDTISSVNDTLFSKGNIFTTNPLQMIFYGEYLVGWERQVTDKYSYLFGIGLIYRDKKTNIKLNNLGVLPYDTRIVSDYYKGFHIFTGIKKYYKKHLTFSNILFFKYERDHNFNIAFNHIDRYYGLSDDYPNIDKKITRDKFVFGYKFLFGLHSNKLNVVVINCYAGFGLRFKYIYYPPNYNKKYFITIPSIHLGFTIGYRTR